MVGLRLVRPPLRHSTGVSKPSAADASLQDGWQTLKKLRKNFSRLPPIISLQSGPALKFNGPVGAQYVHNPCIQSTRFYGSKTAQREMKSTQKMRLCTLQLLLKCSSFLLCSSLVSTSKSSRLFKHKRRNKVRECQLQNLDSVHRLSFHILEAFPCLEAE